MLQSAQRDWRRPRGASARRWHQYRPLLGLVLLAAAVLGYWAVSERPRATPASDSAGGPALQLIPDRRLPDPQRRLLDELTVEQAPPGAARSEFSLQRRRDGRQAGFSLTPPGYHADAAEVESLFSALLSAVAERRLVPAGKTDDFYRAYGVAADQCRVRVRFGRGQGLCFGADSPSGSVYVRADHAPEILVVERALFDLLSRPPAHYRTRRLVPEALGNAHRLELGSLHLFHDGDLWRVQLPDGGWALAEPARVAELLQGVAGWAVTAWPPPPSPFPEAPPLRLVVDGAELWRGGWPCTPESAPPARLFVRGDGEWVCAAAPAATRLPRGTELRAPSLLPVPGAQVARLQVASTVDVIRQPDGTYTQSGQPADTASVRRILALLTASRPLAEAGPTLPPPDAVRLIVTTVLGQSITLQLWRRAAILQRTDHAAQTLVQRDHEPAQLLDDSVAELLALTPLSLAPLQLLAIAPEAAWRISRRGSAAEVLDRTAGWHLQEPTFAPADSTAVQTLLAVLSDLRAERWVSQQSRPEYGLDPPRLRLVITAENADHAEKKESDFLVGVSGKPELSLEVGGPASAGGDCYARRQAGAPVAVLPEATCAALGQPLLSPGLLRIDEDRMNALQLTASFAPAASRSCLRRAGRWQCGTRALSATAQRALFTALQSLRRGERPSYAPPPAPPPHWTLRLTHAPLGSATLRPSALEPAAEVGDEVAPPEQTLRLYPAPDGGLVARLDQRAVLYHLPDSTWTALLAALPTALAPAP